MRFYGVSNIFFFYFTDEDFEALNRLSNFIITTRHLLGEEKLRDPFWEKISSDRELEL